MSTNEISIVILAQNIARDIFEVGNDPRGDCFRIQFKVGQFNNEISGGGLIESALVNVIEQSLRNHIKKV